MECVAETDPKGLDAHFAEAVVRATGGSNDARGGTDARYGGVEQARSAIRAAEPVDKILEVYPPRISRRLPLEASTDDKSSPCGVQDEGRRSTQKKAIPDTRGARRICGEIGIHPGNAPSAVNEPVVLHDKAAARSDRSHPFDVGLKAEIGAQNYGNIRQTSQG